MAGQSDGELNVRVGSSYEPKGINDAENAIQSLVGKTAKASNQISQNLAKSAQATVNAGGMIAKGSNQAAFALNNLGRVAQDAPFGFIGIQNNLNPLLESFQRLKEQSGSTGAALKALGSSLIGPAGLGLALSLVSSAILLYTEYQRKADKADEERVKNTKSAKEALEAYIETLDIVTQTQIKGINNSQKEITTLKQLYNASQNLNIPLGERKRAAQELIDQYPKTFENFSAEQIALGKASSAYQQLSKDIIATAKAAARTEVIASNSVQILQGSEQIFQLGKQLEKQKQLVDLAKKRTLITNSEAETSKKQEDVNRQLSAQGELILKINKLNADINVKKDQNLRLEKQTTDEIVKQQSVTSLIGTDEKAKKTAKEVKSLADIMADLSNELKINEGQLDKTFNEKRLADLDSYQKAIDELTKSGFKPQSAEISNLVAQYEQLAKVIRGTDLAPISSNAPKDTGSKLTGIGDRGIALPSIKEPISALQKLRSAFGYTNDELNNFVANFGLGFDQILSKTITFNEQISGAINNGLIASFAGIGDAIGSSLANGSNIIEALGNSLLGTFGDLLIQLGKIAIETGVGIQAIKTALKTLNPVVAIGAGVALIALGSLIKGKLSNIGSGKSPNASKSTAYPQFANGGLVYGNTLAQVGEYPGASSNPEVIAPLDKLKDIIGSRGTNISLGGSLSISMRELVLGIRAEEKLMGRTG